MTTNKILLTAALMALAASPALAAASHHRAYSSHAAKGAYAQAFPTSTAVVSGGKIVGSDPDSFVRFDLRRQGDQTMR